MFEHIFHIFGGGCGEHMMLPALVTLGASVGVARQWLRARVLTPILVRIPAGKGAK